MCQFQQLYNDETGYVVRCNRCNYYQVLFLGTMISVSEAEFEKFMSQISDEIEHDQKVDLLVKSIVLPTPKAGVHMFLSVREFSKFKKMMEMAEDEIKALALLELFLV